MKYVIKNGIILDGSENMEPVQGKMILVEDGIIQDIQDEKEMNGYEVIDLQGKYIMPGLINMHVHLAGNGKPQKKQYDYEKLVSFIFSNPIGRFAAKKLVEYYAKLELYSGVTTIRTVGGLRNLDSTIRNEINDRKLVGPRILCSDEGISVVGGHMAGSVAHACRSVEEAVKLVDERKQVGCDFVKLMITGGVMDAKVKGMPGEMKMKEDMIQACCEEAKKNGMYVSAHVESTEGVKIALKHGVKSIEHGAKPDEEMISLFKEKDAFLITTLSCTVPYALFDRSVSNASEVEQFNGNVVFEGIKECSKVALENGIKVGLGNDVGCPWISQYDFWRELVYFHKFVGVSNRFALFTATKRNAELAGIGDITGSIEKGKSADLIVTQENPLEDLHALKQVDMVIIKGNIHDHPKYKKNETVSKQLDNFC